MPWGAVVGAVATAGANKLLGGKSSGQSQSSQAQIDPRIAEFVYGNVDQGTPGLLGPATRLYQDQASQGGLNDMQRAGMEMQRQTLMSPAFTQGAQAAQGLGLGLLGAGVASNPFSTGQASLGGGSPQGLIAAGRGLLGGGLLGSAQPQQPQGGLLSQAQTIRPAAQTYQPMQFDANPTLQAAGSPITRPADIVTPPGGFAQAQPSLDQQWQDYLDKMLDERETARRGPANNYQDWG